MNGTRCLKAVILRQKIGDMKLGLLAIGGAWLNYRKAKAEYEALKEKQETLQAAVDTYNLEKNEKYDEWEYKYLYGVDEVEENNRPDGIEVSTVLRVGNIVGKIMRVHGSVVMTNTSNQTILINKVAARWFLFNQYIYIIEDLKSTKESEQSVYVGKYIKPGDTLEVQLQKGYASFVSGDEESFGEDLMPKLRETICEACGKKLITSCPKVSIEGLEKANFKVWWGNDNHSFYTNSKPGVLRYCGEAFYG